MPGLMMVPRDNSAESGSPVSLLLPARSVTHALNNVSQCTQSPPYTQASKQH
jgi:hypothetical protein